MTLEEALAASEAEPVNDIFTVNPESRTITVPDTEKIFGVFSDGNTERKHFRCPAIVFDVKQGEQYYIEWSNVRTANKYIYDMRRCGGAYLLYNPNQLAESGSIEIIIPSDGTLYVGIGSNNNLKHGEINAPCFDGDWIKVRKE